MQELKLYNVFKSINASNREGAFIVDAVSEDLPHKIGRTAEGYPLLFVHCIDESAPTDIKLTQLSVLYNRQCSVFDLSTQEQINQKYTIVQLNSTEDDSQKYFLDVLALILMKIGDIPETEQLDAELKRIIALFSKAKSPSRDAVRGLFAELAVIEMSEDPQYLLSSWHVTPQDKFDFNDGTDKVEVKSCIISTREHRFAVEQLYPGDGSELVIASVAVEQTGLGLNVFDMVDRISPKITGDILLLIHLRETVNATVGKYFTEVSEFRFDYGITADSYALYDYKQLPKIALENVPAGVSRVKFSVNLAGLKPTSPMNYTSKLIRSLR